MANNTSDKRTGHLGTIKQEIQEDTDDLYVISVFTVKKEPTDDVVAPDNVCNISPRSCVSTDSSMKLEPMNISTDKEITKNNLSKALIPMNHIDTKTEFSGMSFKPEDCDNDALFIVSKDMNLKERHKYDDKLLTSVYSISSDGEDQETETSEVNELVYHTCSLCGSHFAQSSYLEEHLLTKHKMGTNGGTKIEELRPRQALDGLGRSSTTNKSTSVTTKAINLADLKFIRRGNRGKHRRGGNKSMSVSTRHARATNLADMKLNRRGNGATELKHARGTHKCLVCKDMYQSQNLLRHHVMDKHLERRDNRIVIKGTECMGSELQTALEKYIMESEIVEAVKGTVKKTTERIKMVKRSKKTVSCEPKGFTLHRCSICGCKFIEADQLKEHLSHYHFGGTNMKNSNLEARWKACMEQIQWTSPKGFMLHNCSICGSKFLEADLLKEHLRHSHSEEEANLQKLSAMEETSIEQMKWTSSKGFTLHSCSICGCKFIEADLLKEHLHHSHFGGSNLQKLGVRGEACLDQMIHTHQVLQPHKCPNCGKGCATHETLLIHMREHTSAEETLVVKDSDPKSDRSYCSVGRKAYQFVKRPMTEHAVPEASDMSGGTRKKFYRCHVCGDRYHSHNGFVSHLKAHPSEHTDDIHVDSGEKTCLLCSKSFPNPQMLRSHERETHIQCCAVCGRFFSKTSNLGLHLTSKHAEKSGILHTHAQNQLSILTANNLY